MNQRVDNQNNHSDAIITASIDTRGLNCPLPILKTKKELAKLQQGENLRVEASDPGSVKDIASFCTQTGHHLLVSESTDEGYVFVVQKSN